MPVVHSSKSPRRSRGRNGARLRAKPLGSGHQTEADSGGRLRTPRVERRSGSRVTNTAHVPGCPTAWERPPGYRTVAASDSYRTTRGSPLGLPAPTIVRGAGNRSRHLSLGRRFKLRASARTRPERVQSRLLRGLSKHSVVPSNGMRWSGLRHEPRARLWWDGHRGPERSVSLLGRSSLSPDAGIGSRYGRRDNESTELPLGRRN